MSDVLGAYIVCGERIAYSVSVINCFERKQNVVYWTNENRNDTSECCVPEYVIEIRRVYLDLEIKCQDIKLLIVAAALRSPMADGIDIHRLFGIITYCEQARRGHFSVMRSQITNDP